MLELTRQIDEKMKQCDNICNKFQIWISNLDAKVNPQPLAIDLRQLRASIPFLLQPVGIVPVLVVDS